MPSIQARHVPSAVQVLTLARSGFAANAIGGCDSNFPVESFTASTACIALGNSDGKAVPVTFSYDGEEVTGTQWVNTNTEPVSIISTKTVVLVESSARDGSIYPEYPKTRFVGFTHMPMVFLVNSGEDGGDNRDGNRDSDGGPNAAPGGRGALDAGLATLMVVWGVAGLIRVGLMAPF
ncbi:hypothetical protein FALCPG4_015529 [Fusarium falciforme]